MAHCLLCGRSVDTGKFYQVLVLEAHTGRLGSAYLHCHCGVEASPTRYKQVVQWETRITNLEKVIQLHRRLASANGAFGSVPLLLG
jgi:hypothetical protein